MSWAIGYDDRWQRDIGYGVPAICDHPKCNAEIHRGLGYVCGADVYGGEKGCGLFFCSQHQQYARGCMQMCERCAKRRKPFTPKPDIYEWVHHKHTDESWEEWRLEQAKP